MKIAFTTSGKTWRDPIDIRFGRAKGFFIVDSDTDETSFIDNYDNTEASQGAGTGAASMLVNNGVKEIVTGKIGPKAAAVFKKSGIKVWGGIGYASIIEAYERYKKGNLTEQIL
ncbi:MAG: NifB/NifX family molybdenum-iron cluster-binding protein [Calditrichaceae bacterium]|nr:NifB/NifX family molybdenum-iron cluster-binding protein [Calditrichaceae bacterium]MBN2708223.1 NifB/NifX family molybdenum-iron cluster-binding protein [Calditrichaceae bacterium]RQV92247.1 MAG: dinitrogenase iron-molybdenum cofactor biosynthesis protein [Calditrichota bacterium]